MSCKKNDNVMDVTGSSLATDFYDDKKEYASINENNGLLCKLIIEKDTLTIKDTLRVKYSFTNTTDVTKACLIEDYILQFTLKTNDGRTVMKYPASPISGKGTVYFSPHGNFIYDADQKIKDESNIPITPGLYKLRARVNFTDFPTLMLSVTIK